MEIDMIETPHIVESEEIAAAVIHLKVPRAELPNVVPAAISELMKALTAQGLSPQGPLFMHHLTMSPETFDVEVGFPVAKTITLVGRVRPGKLPAAKVARTIYQGPYEGLFGAWDAFGKRLESDGLVDQSCVERAGTLWESYLTGPETTSDPTRWRTELNLPLLPKPLRRATETVS
jgi:effector-binding domain-containing protein